MAGATQVLALRIPALDTVLAVQAWARPITLMKYVWTSLVLLHRAFLRH